MVPERFDPRTSDFAVTPCGSDHLSHTVPGRLAADIATHAPGARVSIVPRPGGAPSNAGGDVEALPARGEVDLLVSVGDAVLGDHPRLELYREDVVCVSSFARHAAGRAVSPEDLSALRHVILGQVDPPVRRSIDARFAGRFRRATSLCAYRTSRPSFKPCAMANMWRSCPARSPRRTGWRCCPPLDLPPADIMANRRPRPSSDPRRVRLRKRLTAIARDYG